MSPNNTRSNSLQPSRSSGTHFSCSSDQFSLPASIASRREAGPRKYPWANSSMSRTLRRWPATAFTKRSSCSGETPFMRLNGRNVYM
jgi:hypothetical protein